MKEDLPVSKRAAADALADDLLIVKSKGAPL